VTRAVTGGVDTHADVHVAAALDSIGGLLGVQEFPATPDGYARLLGWLGGFGAGRLVGIEGTGSYGAGLARHIAGAGVRVVEVDRSDRQDRRRQGKSDPLDAISAARAAQSGRVRGAPRGRDGTVEAIRVLLVAKRTARSERTQTINQARSLACDLTFLLSVRLQSEFSLDGLADVVALCGPAVEGTGWPPGTGFAGFRRTGWTGDLRPDVPEPPPDPGGGEPACSGGRAFPGLAQILGQWPGQPELGMRGDDQPGPAVRCLRGAGLGAGPA
jgi:hypothetical protein